MLPCACYLYDDLALKSRDAGAKEWQVYSDLLWMRDRSLGEICGLLGEHPGDVIAVADGIRVVNSERLVGECRRRNIPVRSFATIRDAAERDGVLGVRFYSVGFGPGMHWRYS